MDSEFSNQLYEIRCVYTAKWCGLLAPTEVPESWNSVDGVQKPRGKRQDPVHYHECEPILQSRTVVFRTHHTDIRLIYSGIADEIIIHGMKDFCTDQSSQVRQEPQANVKLAKVCLGLPDQRRDFFENNCHDSVSSA